MSKARMVILAVVTAVLLAIAGGIYSATPAHAITGCGGKSACFAEGIGYTTGYMQAVGTNLSVYCLTMSGDHYDRVSYDLFISTHGTSVDYYIVEGMRYGYLYDYFSGEKSGLNWFWADYRPNGVYAEHFIERASLSTTRNAAFYHISGTDDWRVNLAGIQRGTSTNNGHQAQRAETGMSTTTPNTTAAGISRNFGYYYSTGPFHLFNPSKFQDPGTWLYTSLGYVNAGMGTCNTSAQASAQVQPRHLSSMPTTPAAYTQALTALVAHAAAANGELHPTGVTYVKTTRKAAARLVGAEVNTNEQVYLVQLNGDFVGRMAEVPPGASLPRGHAMTLSVDAATGRILDWSISPQGQRLTALGPESHLG